MIRNSPGIIAIAMCAGLPLAAAAAKPPLKKLGHGREIQPISIAKVMKVNGQIVLAGDWMPYAGGFIPRSDRISVPFFDSYGREPGTAPAGTIGTNCILSGCGTSPDDGGRWFFGSTYHIPQAIEDMQDCACPPGSVLSEIDLAWCWCPDNNSEPCIVVYFLSEEVLRDGSLCADPAILTGTGGGVAINFGAPGRGCPGFYYFSRIRGLEPLGLLSPGIDDNGDADGLADGTYQMIIASAVTSTAVTLAAGPCQPMLWGTSRGYLGSGSDACCRPGLNNDRGYDDDAPADGVFSLPTECYDYNYGLCPDPLAKANAFCYLRCPADYNNDGFVDSLDSDGFHNAFDAGDRCADLNGDCFTDGIDADYFNNEFDSMCS